MANYKKKVSPKRHKKKPGWQMSLEKRQKDRGARHDMKDSDKIKTEESKLDEAKTKMATEIDYYKTRYCDVCGTHTFWANKSECSICTLDKD